MKKAAQQAIIRPHKEKTTQGPAIKKTYVILTPLNPTFI